MATPADMALSGSAPRAPAEVGCAHCGLAARGGDLYCCYGCELAAQIAREGAEEHGHVRATLLVSLLLSMVVMMLSLFLFSEDVYGASAGEELAWLRTGYRFASGLLATPVVLMLGLPVARRALVSLQKARLSMDLLVSLGAFAAYGISVYSLVAGRHGVYFDSAVSALLLSTLGRYLEARGRAQASSLLGPSLKRSTEPVMVAKEGEPTFSEQAPSLVLPGDRLRIDTEEVLPVDARLLTGPADVNLGVLTGESVPVVKQAGDELPAGAIIVSGAVEVIALRALHDSTLERLSDLAKKLSARPASLQRWADRFAAAMTPLVALIAMGTLVFHARRATGEEGVIAALSVVLAACPCTYGVATPLVFWLALRKALSHGALVRNASVLEDLSTVRAVAFDKTGTLTERSLSVSSVKIAHGVTEPEVRALVASLEEGTKHPVGRALEAYASPDVGHVPAATPALKARKHLAGRGVCGTDLEGRPLLLGSPSWLAEMGIDDLGSAEDRSRVRVALAREGRTIAWFEVGEALKPEAREAVSALAEMGISSFMLTGDGTEGAAVAARVLGIEAHAGLSAEDKVRALERAGGGVAMVGDGLNDAPALAGSRTSFAVHGGTDLARGMAQVSLLTPDLRLVPWTVALARRSFSIARWNLLGSTAYNLIFLTLAATGMLKPVWAGLSMATSSLLMIASALRVRTFPPPIGWEPPPEAEDRMPELAAAPQEDLA